MPVNIKSWNMRFSVKKNHCSAAGEFDFPLKTMNQLFKSKLIMVLKIVYFFISKALLL